MNWEAGPPQTVMYQHPDLGLSNLHNWGRGQAFTPLAILLDTPRMTRATTESKNPKKNNTDKHGIIQMGVDTLVGKVKARETRRLEIRKMLETGFIGKVLVYFYTVFLFIV